MAELSPPWQEVDWDIATKPKKPVRHGTAGIFHILPTDEFLFFRRSIDNPAIPFPGRICLIGGGKKDSDATPLDAFRREVFTELTDLSTGRPVALGHVEHVARLYDSRPGVIDLYAHPFESEPDFAINEGSGLVTMSRHSALEVDLPYGFTRIFRDYVESHPAQDLRAYSGALALRANGF